MVFVLPGLRSLGGDALFCPGSAALARNALASLAVIFDRS
jgi:hypothetical protein